MKNEQEMLNNFINTLPNSLSDEEINNLKIYSPKTVQLIAYKWLS